MKTRYIFIFLLIICIINFLIFDNRVFIKNTSISNYTPISTYEETYPINNYVDEQLNSPQIFRTNLINLLLDSENVILSDEKIKDIILDIIFPSNNYGKFSQDYQYIENTLISLNPVSGYESHNFEFTGYLSDNTEVTGNVAIYFENSNYSIAISLLNEEKQIDKEKCLLLIDDSNSEMLTYLIIEATQDLYSTDMEPNEAALHFYDNSIEQIAGSISYHAFISYFLNDLDAQEDELLTHTRVINIKEDDYDSFYINRSY